MKLSDELLSAFVDVTKSDKKTKDETIVYGRIVERDGVKKVKIDGSDIETPISTTADTIVGERVTVMIKNHMAVVTGNMSSPAARTADVTPLKTTTTLIAKDDQNGVLIGDKSSGEWNGFRIQILGDELNILNASGKAVATFDSTSVKNAHGDFVSVAKGTSGIWSYKKWSNGDVELTGSYVISEAACETDFGGWFRTDEIDVGTFPFEVHNANLVASYESDGYGAMLWATTATTAANPPSYYLIRPTNETITSGKINFHVIGKATV